MIDAEQLIEDRKAAKRAYHKEWAKTYNKSQAFKDAQKRYYTSEHGAAKRRALKQLPEYKALAKARYQARRDFLNRTKIAMGCIDCGYVGHPAALEFDHVRGIKRIEIGKMGMRAWKVIFEELAKCEIRCANCHRIKTYGAVDA